MAKTWTLHAGRTWSGPSDSRFALVETNLRSKTAPMPLHALSMFPHELPNDNQNGDEEDYCRYEAKQCLGDVKEDL
jgi:hypothetical protein